MSALEIDLVLKWFPLLGVPILAMIGWLIRRAIIRWDKSQDKTATAIEKLAEQIATLASTLATTATEVRLRAQMGDERSQVTVDRFVALELRVSHLEHPL